jgi:hypothetical protein
MAYRRIGKKRTLEKEHKERRKEKERKRTDREKENSGGAQMRLFISFILTN